MPRLVRIQTDFASGEVDPLLRSRIDLKQYYSALQTASNVFILPQGGAKRRDGLKFVAELPSAAAPQNGVRLIPFEFNTTDSYMFCVVNQRIYIFRSGALVTNINGSGNNYLAVSAITSSMLSTLRHAQSADTMILVHEDLTPLKIVRGASHSTWTVSTISFTNAPKHAFTLTTTNPSSNIDPDKSTGNIKVTASSATWHSGRSATAQAGASTTITLDSSASATNDIFNGATIRITSGTGSGQERIISDYVGSTKVATVSVAWSTNPASDSVFSIDSQVGQYINHTASFGRLRITEIVSDTICKAFAEVALFDDESISTGDWELESGYEDAWSTDRGYPKSITFHEGRLFFAGSKSLPTTFWGSVVNSFFDFDKGEATDDRSLEATITTESLNAIVDIFSGRDLQIFTTGGEFYVPQSTDDPITPSSLVVRMATRNGAKEGIPVVGLDSGTMFIQRQGKQLNELLFTDVELTYTTSNVSLLSGHLLKSPTDMAIRRATSTEEADRLFIVNSTDGSMCCYSLLRAQQVVAPSSVTTEGLEANDQFKAVAVDVDTIYTVVKRSLPTQATATITVTDASNIAAGSTIEIKENDGTATTMTATTDDPAGALFFSVGGSRTQNDIADNIAVGTGGSLGINALSGFSAPNPAANVVTVTRATAGSKNATVTSSDGTRLAVTDFTGGSTDKYYVEIFDASLHTDSSVYSASASSTGTAAHLPLETLDVIVDGNVQSSKTSNGSGVVTFDRASTSNYEIGLPFSIELKTMPLEPRLQSGSIKGFKKRVLKVNAEVYQSQAMSINGQLVAFRAFGEDVLDISVPKFTGVKTVGPLLGFVDEGTITVTQTAPLDLNLLALDYQLSVGQ
tara:strand:+ start:5297 stop:7870 length:2574 start_codon:yes stop_codon:yes gene_type:complete